VNKDKKPLSETHPKLAKEAHDWDPTTVVAGTNKKLAWKCQKGHVWNATGSNRLLGRGCPFCSNKKILIGENDLATTHPHLAKEAHEWDPTTVVAGSNKKLAWKCKKGHVWESQVYDRVNGNTCGVCSNRVLLKGVNDLATTHPELAKEAHGWDATTVFSGSNKLVEWKCQKGHIWKTSGNDRVNGNTCGVCSNRVLLKGVNDLATTHPKLAKEAHGWDPTENIAGTNKKLKWRCSNNHIWIAQGNARIRGSGCPVCTNRKIVKGDNDLASTHPELAKEAHGWDPTTVVAGTKKKLEWKCQKGHVWQGTGDKRVIGGGCPVCTNRKIVKGDNDLASTHPELAKEAHGWDPTTVVAGTAKKMKWKCEQGHEWITSGHDRISGRGCPSCSKSGFDPNLSGYIYFLIQPNWEIYQIGITNNPEDRIVRHKRNGFDLLELRGPMEGQTAQELETAILRYLKSQKADLSPEHIAGKFDGYSESWTIDSYKVNNLKELIDKASEAGF